jgi:hypothetical protein
MLRAKARKLLAVVVAITVIAFGVAYAQQGPRGKSSYMEVEINEPFSQYSPDCRRRSQRPRGSIWRFSTSDTI